MLYEHRITYKALVTPVLAVPSFSRDFWVLRRQLSLQELEGLPPHFLITLGAKEGGREGSIRAP